MTFPVLADTDGNVSLAYADPFGWGFPLLPWDAIVSQDWILCLSEDLYDPSGDSLYMSRVIPIFDSLFTPEIGADPDVINFGDVAVDTFAQADIVLDNTGTGLLEITDIITSSPVFSVDVTQGDIFAMDDSLVITVTFAPTEEIPYSETMTIFSPDDTLEVDLLGAGAPVGVKNHSALPQDFTVSCFPNPFNGALAVSLKLTHSENVSVDIYNVRGCRQAQLWQGPLDAGVHQLNWTDEDTPSGVYLVKVSGENWCEVRKAVMVR